MPSKQAQSDEQIILNAERGDALEKVSDGGDPADVLEKFGSLTNSGDRSSADNSGVINNTGTINNFGTINNANSFYSTNSGTINNAGTITNSPTSVIQNVAGGIINDTGTIMDSGHITNAGNVFISRSGVPDLTSAGIAPYIQTGGSTVVNGSINGIPGQTILSFEGGTLGGKGTINGAVSMAGTVIPGSFGTR